MRRWTPDERSIVKRGLFGRLAIAVEPAILALLFVAFTIALLHIAGDGKPEHEGLPLLALIIGFGAVPFAIYAVWMMLAPIRALRETYQPIFVVDGYLRTRGRDDFSERGFNGYVAVLLDNRRVACEWPTVGDGDLPLAESAALLEFSEHGGIHSVDGRATGVLPADFRNIGIRTNRPPR